MSLNLQLLWELKGGSSEWHHIDSASDLFYHSFLNFGVTAVKSLNNKEIEYQLIDYSRLREVILFNYMQKKGGGEGRSNQTKPNPFLEATLKNKLHGWTSRAEAQHGIHEYALYIIGRSKWAHWLRRDHVMSCHVMRSGGARINEKECRFRKKKKGMKSALG